MNSAQKPKEAVRTIPLCRTCKYFVPTGYLGVLASCSHPATRRNPVDNSLEETCDSLRSGGHCGYQGKHHNDAAEMGKSKDCNSCKWVKKMWFDSEHSQCTHPYVVAAHFDPVNADIPYCSTEREYGTKCGTRGELHE